MAKHRVPVELILDNLAWTPVVGGRRYCWAQFELQSKHYDFLPEVEMLRYHERFSSLLRELADVPEAVLFMVPEQIYAARDQRALISQIQHRYTRDAHQYIEIVAGALDCIDAQQPVRYRTYLAIRLPQPPRLTIKGAVGALRTGFTEAVRYVEDLAGLDGDLREEDLQLWQVESERLAKRLGSIGNSTGTRLRPLTSGEVIRLVQRPLWRSLDQPQPVLQTDAEVRYDQRGRMRLRPRKQAILGLYGGQVHHEGQHIRVRQVVDGTPIDSYQSFLALEAVADTHLPVIGGEWAYQLQGACGHVEIYLRFRGRSFEDTLRALESQRRKLADVSDQEQEHAGGETLDTTGSQAALNEMEVFLKETRSPMLLTSVVLALSAKDAETLRDRVRRADLFFRSLDCRVVLNETDQLRHWRETLLAAPCEVGDYEHPLFPHTVAHAMLGLDDQLGDPEGLYIGIDEKGRPVRYSSVRALAELDTSGSHVFVGPMGKGKSATANHLAILAALVYDGLLLAIDSAKPERSAWPELLPWLGPYCQVISLSASEADRGKLDPWAIFPDRREATNHAVSVLSWLTQTPVAAEGYDVLLKAATTVGLTSPEPCLMGVVTQLYEFAQQEGYPYPNIARRLAERLVTISQLAYASLLFGDGSGNKITFEKRVTVLQLDRITQPPADKAVEDYSLDEYLSAALMTSSVALAAAFGRGDRRRLKVILGDEIRWFVNNQYGRDLISQQTLVGRAMGTFTMLVGQNVSHIPADLHQHFTRRFSFGAANHTEAVATLEFMGVEASDENVARLMALNPGDVKGQCLLRDLEGRVGMMQIDMVVQDLIDAYATRSLTAQTVKEAGD